MPDAAVPPDKCTCSCKIMEKEALELIVSVMLHQQHQSWFDSHKDVVVIRLRLFTGATEAYVP